MMIVRVPSSLQHRFTSTVDAVHCCPVPAVHRTLQYQLLLCVSLFPDVHRQTGEVRARRDQITPDGVVGVFCRVWNQAVDHLVRPVGLASGTKPCINWYGQSAWRLEPSRLSTGTASRIALSSSRLCTPSNSVVRRPRGPEDKRCRW